MLARTSRGWTVALAAALLLAATSAHAEEDAANRAAARKLAEDGVAALQNGDSATAVQKLEKAHQMLAVPSVALWSARALAKRGSWVEAAERLREVARLQITGDAAVQEQAKRDAEKELNELVPRIPNLVITLAGAPTDVNVTLDGAAIPPALLGEDRPVNPGKHQLVAQRGAERAVQEVSVAEGERKPVELRLGAPSPAPLATPVQADAAAADRPTPASGSGRKTLAFVTLGAGALGLVVGGVSGGMAIAKNNALNDNPACAGDVCTHAAEDDVNSLHTLRTVSTIGFIAGGVLAAGGVVLWLTSDSQPAAAAARSRSLAFGVSPGFVQLRGSFQ
jgi:hypothetical protein